MGKTNFDELELVTNLPNAEIACPNSQETLRTFIAGAVAGGAKQDQILIGVACTVVDIRAYADTAPTGQALIVDVNKNGVTLFTTQANRPSIAATQNASSTTLPDIVALAAGDRLSFDVDQVGNGGETGQDLTISVTVKRANVA